MVGIGQNLSSISGNNLYELNRENKVSFNSYSTNNQEKSDSLELSFKASNNKKVSFEEGCKLVAKGFLSKVCNIGTSIIKHPVKTLGLVTLTSASLAALPLIGISAATGAAVLAIGFAAVAVAKTVGDSVKAFRHNKDNDYNALRKDLQNIGGDTVDLALSLPFIPRAISTVKNQIKYGSAIGLNRELLTELGKTEGLINKIKVLNKANLQLTEDINFKAAIDKFKVPAEIKTKYLQLRTLKGEEFAKAAYDQLVKDMGYEGAAPKMIIDETLTGNTIGNYNPATGELRLSAKAIKEFPQSKILNFQRHELEHFRQFSDIARTEGLGLEALARAEAKARIENLKSGKTGVFDFDSYRFDRTKTTPEQWKKWETDLYNKRLEEYKAVSIYKDAIKAKGTIKAESPEALQAEKYIDATVKYPDMTFSFIAPPKEYRESLLEEEAWNAGENIGKQYGTCETAQKIASKTADSDTLSKAVLATAARDIATISNPKQD